MDDLPCQNRCRRRAVAGAVVCPPRDLRSRTMQSCDRRYTLFAGAISHMLISNGSAAARRQHRHIGFTANASNIQ